MTDFSLVFQMSDNFCFSRQGPDQTASIRGWDSNWGFNFDIFRVNSCSCFIHQFNQLLQKRNKKVKGVFSNFSCRFLNPNYIFSNLNYNCSNVLDLRNLQKLTLFQKLSSPLTVRIICSSDFKHFPNEHFFSQ